jgi:hypothetical protein
MDLKRAWRNGFLASVIFAIPLSDLYNSQYSNFIVDNNAREAHARHADSGLADGNDDDIANGTTSWDNNIDENGLTLPGNTLTDLLLESGDTDFGDIQKTATQFDPQDFFQSERIGEVDLDNIGSTRQNIDANIGPLASLTYGFGNSAAYAPGFSGPYMPAMFAPGGKITSAGLRNSSGENSEPTFVDPLSGSSTQTDTASSGMDNESLHTVPETSSLVLITIGTISVASHLYRKSKSQTYHF